MNSTHKVFATIITIGDELLIGQVVDTNSAWMAQQLNEIGVLVKRRISVGDDASEIRFALQEAASISSIVLITGGLGPTADDITKPVLCEYFGGTMVVDDGALQNVQEIFRKLNRPIIDRNLKQAEVPDVCKVVQNKRGTAPGMWFEKEGVIYVSMPGVPHEMKGMMLDDVLPQLQKALPLPAVSHRTLMTFGIGESYLADLIQDWEAKLPGNIKLAYLPNYGLVRLRLTAVGEKKMQVERQLDETFTELQLLVKDYMVTDLDEPLPVIVGKLLKKHTKNLVLAESCTGGYLAHLITAIPGSSAYFSGSIVSYSNYLKNQLLLVGDETLKAHGAVSEEVVKAMANGALKETESDYAIAVSGIMGPDGGSAEKPVGTVWIAVANAQQVIAKKMHFRYDRSRNIEMTSMYALNMLRQLVIADMETSA
ncbi:MAG TPA: competence/damage-inducible protein A [Phnomibacter sp.]|nr:competence/damage-inducible protein A [Phnomibacter sp.]